MIVYLLAGVGIGVVLTLGVLVLIALFLPDDNDDPEQWE